jgi:hypothetical protein
MVSAKCGSKLTQRTMPHHRWSRHCPLPPTIEASLFFPPSFSSSSSSCSISLPSLILSVVYLTLSSFGVFVNARSYLAEFPGARTRIARVHSQFQETRNPSCPSRSKLAHAPENTRPSSLRKHPRHQHIAGTASILYGLLFKKSEAYTIKSAFRIIAVAFRKHPLRLLRSAIRRASRSLFHTKNSTSRNPYSIASKDCCDAYHNCRPNSFPRKGIAGAPWECRHYFRCLTALAAR